MTVQDRIAHYELKINKNHGDFDPLNQAVTFNVTTINDKSCHFPFYDKLTRKSYDSCGTVTTNPLLREQLGLDKSDNVGWCKTDSTSYAICQPEFKEGVLSNS